MNEQDLIENIGNIIGQDYIGDDCAFLNELGIVISQDSFIENIHFKREWCTPFQIGYKSVAVNISDILASGAVPKYITIALSLPNSLDDNFVTDFYNGAISCLHGAKIVGGDITGSIQDIIISITAIGITKNRNISSRKSAKEGYILITKGEHGTSAMGLEELKHNGQNLKLIKSHLEPLLEYDFSNSVATNVNEPYAMMDTSDGLADTLFKISKASEVKIVADYNKIPHNPNAKLEQVLFGGEDYKLVAAIPPKYLNLINDAVVIGNVVPFDGVRLEISGKKYTSYNELNVYKHF